jgi:hypothetical protein
MKPSIRKPIPAGAAPAVGVALTLGKRMIARSASLILCVLLVGCATATKIVMLSPTDPALMTKLELAREDWRSISQLASKETGWVMLYVAKISSDTVEVHFKRPNDRLSDQGGPVRRYQKKDGSWLLTDYHSEWVVHLVI